MRKNLQNGYSVDDYFPAVADLPEKLTTEQFRHDYGGVGAPRYRQVVIEIDARLNRCAALALPGAVGAGSFIAASRMNILTLPMFRHNLG